MSDNEVAREAKTVTVETPQSLAEMVRGASPNEDAKPETTETAETPPADSDKPKGKKGASDRIRELIDQRNDARKALDDRDRQIQDLMSRLNSRDAIKPIEEKPAPQRSQFATDEDFIDAKAEWKANQVLAKREAEVRREADEKQQKQVIAGWNRRMADAEKELPDFKDVIQSSSVEWPPHLAAPLMQAILESDQGPYIAYYLASNPDEARRMYGMSIVKALREIAKLEDKLSEEPEPAKPEEKKSTVQVSKAPPPSEPVKASVGIGTSAEASDFDTYRERRKAELSKKARR